MTASNNPVRCPQCGELNSPHAELCVICRTKLNHSGLQKDSNIPLPVAQQLAPQSHEAPSAFQEQAFSASRLTSNSSKKQKRRWIVAWLCFVVAIAGFRINQALHAPGVGAVLRGTLTTTPSTPGVTAAPAATPLDKALVVAVSKGQSEEVRRLLDQGANPSTASAHGVPALVIATSRGYLPIVQILIEKGCNVNIKMADRSPKGEMIGGYTALHFAGMKGHPDVLQYLLSKGANINMKTVDGSTPLDVTAMMGTPDAVRILIEAGSDVNHKTNDGLSPLLGAAQQGKTENVRVLIEKGADINIKGPFGESAISHAEKMNHLDTVQVLRDAGAS